MTRRRVRIFDTTLRDGDQTPGVSLKPAEKLEIARQLESLGVDAIEAGFPITSDGDFEGVRLISRALTRARVVALARSVIPDIDRAWAAVREAQNPCIHVFVATSDVHMKHKLGKEPAQVLDLAVSAVRHARSYGCEVEFSAEDATRSRPEFLFQVLSEAVRAGASVVNIPDTVGYAAPDEFGDLIRAARRMLDQQGLTADISVHCHDDLGLATANSLAAVAAGANQVECTINGLGERAGNASLEEVVMAIVTRQDRYPYSLGIDTTRVWPTSRLVSMITGVRVQPNKAVVGQNAFVHQSGVHQDGMLKHRSTYEIMTPESVGVPSSRLVLGKTSGRHALRERLVELGIHLSEDDVDRAFAAFKQLVDRKRSVTDRDLLALVGHHQQTSDRLSLDYYHLTAGNQTTPTATVRLIVDGRSVTEAASGDGPVDAVYQAVNRALAVKPRLADYSLQAVSEGQDALGEVRVVVELDGQTLRGRGLSIDIVEASARAYVDALNRANAVMTGRPDREVG